MNLKNFTLENLRSQCGYGSHLYQSSIILPSKFKNTMKVLATPRDLAHAIYTVDQEIFVARIDTCHSTVRCHSFH